MVRSHELAGAVVQVFADNQNEKNREGMEAYMKHHFRFFGIKAPEQKKLLSPLLKEYKKLTESERIETARLLFKEEQRECHYAALTILDKGKKEAERSVIDVYKELLMTHSWWDTVDTIASKLCGSYFMKYPDELVPITESWRQSENMWVRRSSVLHQLKFKEETNAPLLYETIGALKGEKEFFIEKAIGWALREYSKSDPESVKAFIEKTDLRPLSRREGLKWMKNKGMLNE
ncbi:DNA alkylation repair protein [Halobacillus litoralis]|uniref:DNA alkylation repair protein n=1 Tax=Halobacillus litoralis TaxID=45668 RepID=UPI001CD65D7D|nr:DNA alkylation repair protein [Halobacillus litoralis]MCA0969468.1 DNA alkylation repair protein [Halobacillus litoralis]